MKHGVHKSWKNQKREKSEKYYRIRNQRMKMKINDRM